MKDISTANVIDTATKVGELAQDKGLANAMAYLLIALALILFVTMFGLLFLLVKELISVKKKKTEELILNIKEMKEEFTKTIKAFQENQVAILEVFSVHREHMENKFDNMKSEAAASLDRLRDKINDGKDIDTKTFDIIATSVLNNALYNIERDISEIIEKNSLYHLKRTLLGNSQTTGEIENKVTIRLDEAINTLKNIDVSDKLFIEIQHRIMIEKELIIKDMCLILDVEKNLIVDEKTKAALRRAAENDLSKHRMNMKKQIEGAIFILGGQ